ncbi:MAG TPA: shikimate dehydrogenase, partial [Allosphingosinicella sp.]|nr:shikimate dehydrogenase [Allosphingosinicella sp.]
MSAPYAEVIGDPIAQTRSPAIHRHWLATLGLPGDYRATRMPPDELADYLAARRGDPDWRGCSVTIPHKRSVLKLLDRIDPAASAIGAVNCILPGLGGLTGRNTDVDGLAAALASAPLDGRKAALIGAGGGARAAIRYLLDAGAAEIAILARNPAAHLGDARVALYPFESCDEALEDAAAIVNATPLGMAGAPPMPKPLLDCVGRHASGATLL